MEDLSAGQILQSTGITGAFDYFFWVLVFIIGIALICVVAFIVWTIKSHKHKLIVKEVIKGRKIVTERKFRDYLDKEGINWYKLVRKLPTGQTLVYPAPPEAVEMTNKGNKFVECYLLEDGSVIWGQDIAEAIPKELTDIQDKKERIQKIKEYAKNKSLIVSYQPLTQKQKMIAFKEFERARLRKGSVWKEVALPIASMGFLFLTIASLLLFAGEYFTPVLEMGDKLNANAEIQQETIKLLTELKTDVQTIKNTDSTHPTEPPN